MNELQGRRGWAWERGPGDMRLGIERRVAPGAITFVVVHLWRRHLWLWRWQ
jgi:hypothetical protein